MRGTFAAAALLVLVTGGAAAELQEGANPAAAGTRQPPASTLDPCTLPAALKRAYGLMSAKRTETILSLDIVPTERLADFRSALDHFTAALDVAMDREIEVLSRYFLGRDPECATAEGWPPGTVLQIEEAKTVALRSYARSLSAMMPDARAEELVETDLQLIRAIEVRLRNLAYQALHAQTH